ncbi:unannotated protein [freshwater metagenome]|uniref:Unannotated protein n=1 Tax=freshwater metagenome TaxID=449393 RepID=A0A6J6I6P4_9ZZZZ
MFTTIIGRYQFFTQGRHIGFRLGKIVLQTFNSCCHRGIFFDELFDSCLQLLRFTRALLDSVSQGTQFAAYFSSGVRCFVALHCVEQTLFRALAFEVFFFNSQVIALAHRDCKTALHFYKFGTHLSSISFESSYNIVGNQLPLIAFHRTSTLGNDRTQSTSALTQLLNAH